VSTLRTSERIAVALLVLLAAATRTRFVAAYFRNVLRTWLGSRLLLFYGDADKLIDVYVNILDIDALGADWIASGRLWVPSEKGGT
jgi:hypothetical protein